MRAALTLLEETLLALEGEKPAESFGQWALITGSVRALRLELGDATPAPMTPAGGTHSRSQYSQREPFVYSAWMWEA